MNPEITLALKVLPDAEDGIVRIDPSDMRLLGVMPGDVLSLSGARMCFARVLPARMEDRNQKLATVSQLLLRNTASQAGQKIRISVVQQKPALAEKIVLQAGDDIDLVHISVRENRLGTNWHERPVTVRDWLRVPSLDRNPLFVQVVETKPEGVVQIGNATQFSFVVAGREERRVSLGGLRDIYRTCQTLVYSRLKANITKTAGSILMIGPAGCGKARLVKRLSEDMGVPLVVLDIHHLVDKQIAQKESGFPISLSEIAHKGQGILLVDHLEVLNLCHASDGPLAAAARAALSQIIGMLEEIPAYPKLIVFGTSSEPLDQRFTDNDCFNLILPVDAPNRLDRHEILLVAAQSLPLAANVDFAKLAAMTPGATARDLNRLVSFANYLSQGEKISQEDFTFVLRNIEFSAAAEVYCDIPDVSWHDVAGLDETRQLLRETLLWSLYHEGIFADSGVKPPRSILLSGGQGTGKTSLVRALANVIPLNFIEMECSRLTTATAEFAAQKLRNCFALARRKTPCLVFLDDIDALFEPYDTSEIAKPLHPFVAQLLNELDNLAKTSGVVAIAATNRPDRLTMEILGPGRFDYALTLPMPDHAARSRILQIHARKLPLAADVDFEKIAEMTKGLSPAELANLCNRVGLMALRKSLGGEYGGISPPVANAALFEQALRGTKS